MVARGVRGGKSNNSQQIECELKTGKNLRFDHLMRWARVGGSRSQQQETLHCLPKWKYLEVKWIYKSGAQERSQGLRCGFGNCQNTDNI